METVDMTIVEALMWFFGGVFVYRILTKILNYGYMLNVYQEALIMTLSLLRMADKNFQKSASVCYNTSVTAGKTEEELERELKANEMNLNLWRSLAIMNIIKMTPNKFQSALSFSNWNEAMNLLKKIRKENV